jgi:hypothetical protein
VDTVETDDDEYEDIERERFRARSLSGDVSLFRRRSAADLASCASAMPFLSRELVAVA